MTNTAKTLKGLKGYRQEIVKNSSKWHVIVDNEIDGFYETRFVTICQVHADKTLVWIGGNTLEFHTDGYHAEWLKRMNS